MASAALSSGQYGTPAIGGLAHMAIMTVTPGTTATAGENLDLRSRFSTVDNIIPCGASNANIAKYVPAFSFAPGAATAADSVKFFMLVQDGAAGVLEPDNGTDLSSTGTIQIMVFGKAA